MNYKVRVKNEVESKEVQELFFELGGRWASCGKTYNDMVAFGEYIFLTDCEMLNYGLGIKKEEITIPQLKDMVVLKRNDKSDRNFADAEYPDANLYLDSGNNLFVFHIPTQTWKESNLNGEEEVMQRLKPIEREMKEYLDPDNGYALITADDEIKGGSNWIEVPEGANFAYDTGSTGILFAQNERKEYLGFIVWQRSETEKVQGGKDNVNNPSHYSNSAIECIDAMEAMLTPEQFIGYLRGNVFKYQWRYQNKNGIEDLHKSQWYLNKLIEKELANNGVSIDW